MKNLKKELCENLIKGGYVKLYDVVEHNYTDNGTRDLLKLIISTNGILPSMTTRPDTMGWW